MIAVKILVEKLKAKGIENAEELCMDMFAAVEETAKELSTNAEADSIEKGVAATLTLVMPVLKPQVEKLVDFNRDGKIG